MRLSFSVTGAHSLLPGRVALEFILDHDGKVEDSGSEAFSRK